MGQRGQIWKQNPMGKGSGSNNGSSGSGKDSLSMNNFEQDHSSICCLTMHVQILSDVGLVLFLVHF